MPNSSAKPLIVFDVDGTLSGGESYDWTTFEEAFPEVTGAPLEGWVRNHNEGQAVDSLEYEAYAELAETEGNRIMTEATAKFDLLAAAAMHRVGHLQIGDMAVWVGVASAHRGPAFDACRYIIDEQKARVPIWKKEHYSADTSAWINCATRADHADAITPESP